MAEVTKKVVFKGEGVEVRECTDGESVWYPYTLLDEHGQDIGGGQAPTLQCALEKAFSGGMPYDEYAADVDEPAPSHLEQALDAIIDMSNADAIACLDPIDDADQMQRALINIASQPDACDVLVLAAVGRRRCREWEIALDATSPHAPVNELLTLYMSGPAKAPSMAWLGQHIKRLQKEAA